ncbi:MAG: HlyD family type I secretion periplasmic adaptor subunit [Desulfobulbaceae bacterium]|nr:HlyD family type I secretion periplasmic adaptor subunit [Desulfobulbaceae bacterium]
MSEKKPGRYKIFNRMQSGQLDLATDIRAAIMARSPSGARAIMWSVAALLFIFLFWAAFSDIEEFTRGEGKVIPTSQIQVIQNLEGGILSELLVNVGDMVDKDQLLLRIDKTRFTSSYQESRVSYLALKAKAARLDAETKGTRFIIPPEIAGENSSIGLREQELFDSRQREHATTIVILEEQVKQRVHELEEMQAKQNELNQSYKLLSRELRLTRPLVRQGAVSEVEMIHLERQASQMKGEIASIRKAIPRVQSKVNEAKMSLQEQRLNFANKAKLQLNDVLAKLEGISASSLALEDRLKRTSVRSPVRGIIKQIMVTTVGGVIQPGMNLIEIVPLEDSLLVETKIKPADIAFLRPKQKAMVKFTAYDFTIYGGLEAELENISADSITDERGNSFYLVRLRTTKNYIGSEADPFPIIPGMVATVDIQTGKKTVLAYLLKPILRAKYMALRER